MTDYNELFKALAAAQADFHSATKDSDNPFYKSKYASLHAINEASREALAKNGLCVMQPIIYENNIIYVRTILGHTSGQFIQSDFPLPPLNANSKNPLQDQGKAISYLRRYALQSILNIAVDDDDGNCHNDYKPAQSTIRVIDETQCNTLIELYNILSDDNKRVAFNALKELGCDSFKALHYSHFDRYAQFLSSLKEKEQRDFTEEMQDV